MLFTVYHFLAFTSLNLDISAVHIFMVVSKTPLDVTESELMLDTLGNQNM